MPFRVSGKNIDVGEALRGRVSARIADALGKYFDGGYSGHATVGKEGFGFRTECAVHLDSGITLQAEGTAADAYASADQAAIRIEKRLRRYHRRLKGRQPARADGMPSDVVTDVAAPSYIIAAPEHDDESEITEFSPAIIAEFDHRTQAALRERSRDGTRHDGRAGRRVPSRRTWPSQPGLSPRRRAYRLDRSSRHGRADAH